MIYAFTDSEMTAFSRFSPVGVRELSPLYSLCGELEEVNGLAEKASGLVNMKLLKRDGDTFTVTPQGTLLASAVFDPDFACAFERKNDGGNALTTLRKGNLWTVCSVCRERKLTLIWTPFSKELLVRWLKDSLLSDYKPDALQRTEGLDLILSYDEWFAFLASQFLFLKRSFSEARPIDRFFRRDDLCSEDWVGYFSGLLTALDSKKHIGAVQYLFQDTNADVLQLALHGLCGKKLLTEQNGVYTYADTAIMNLDNDLLVDTIRVSLFHPEQQPYRTLLSLRKNGVMSMRDDGSAVHLTTSDSVPFDLFLS